MATQNNFDARALRPHPRLLLTTDRLHGLNHEIKTDEVAKGLLADLSMRAERYLLEPLPKRVVEGRRLLAVSRRVLAHVATFALLARLSGDAKYVAAARREMLAAAAFEDWNPSHFLDTAEMAMALAIGLDWLHDDLPADERATLKQALVDKALRPSFVGDHFFITAGNNWNAVCHAGLVFAALVVAEDAPALATATIDRAKQNIGRVADAYGPDGAYDEGPMYWDYGTTFLVLLQSAMESATGAPFDPGVPGLMASADYMAHVVGPSGAFYNYSDCRAKRPLMPAMFWFAEQTGRPAVAAADRQAIKGAASSTVLTAPHETDRLLPFALIWQRPVAGEVASEELPRFWSGGGRTPVAMMRTAWHDPNAAFLAIKGGSPSNSHGHMDVGSFVYETAGVRWALDLPMQEYHSLEAAGLDLWNNAQGSDRWTVFRLGAEGHGILRFNNQPQAVGGMGTMQTVPRSNAIGSVAVDLSAIYPSLTTRVTRKATLLNDGSAVIEDEWLAAGEPLNVAWQLITAAAVETTPDGFVLRQDGKRLRIRIEQAGDGVQVDATDVNSLLRNFDTPNPGVSRLCVRVTTAPGEAGRLRIRLTPDV